SALRLPGGATLLFPGQAPDPSPPEGQRPACWRASGATSRQGGNEVSAPGSGKITVLIADDHPVVRQGLRVLLSLESDIEVVGEASDGAEAVELTAAVAPDVVLLDLKLPGLDGLGVLAELRDAGLPARVLVLTSVADPASVTVAMRVGAAGFLYKDVDPD